MKKSLFAITLALAAFGAQAQVVGGVVIVGGGASGFSGSTSGTAFSNTEGMAVAASQVNGAGTSFQHTDGFSGGNAAVGGAVNQFGAQVVTNVSQYAQTNSYGSVTGNAPIEVGGAISNGTAGFGQTKVGANGNSQFSAGAIGGIIAIGGVAAFGQIN